MELMLILAGVVAVIVMVNSGCKGAATAEERMQKLEAKVKRLEELARVHGWRLDEKN